MLSSATPLSNTQPYRVNLPEKAQAAAGTKSGPLNLMGARRYVTFEK